MCGRFALYSPTDLIKTHFKISEELSARPRYNIAPGQRIDVVRRNSSTGQHEGVSMLWGLIPFWAKERKISYKLINARAETLEEKPSFKKSFQQYRCLVPANGFYEWKKPKGSRRKQPFFIQRQDEDVFSFAGLWSQWTDKNSGEVVESCTIITTIPNSLLAEIHDRMPVILQPSKYEEWLGPNHKKSTLNSILRPIASDFLKSYPVSNLCNSVKNDTHACVEQIDPGSMQGT